MLKKIREKAERKGKKNGRKLKNRRRSKRKRGRGERIKNFKTKGRNVKKMEN